MCLLLLLMINESVKVSPFSVIYVFCVCIISVLAAALNLESLRLYLVYYVLACPGIG